MNRGQFTKMKGPNQSHKGIGLNLQIKIEFELWTSLRVVWVGFALSEMKPDVIGRDWIDEQVGRWCSNDDIE